MFSFGFCLFVISKKEVLNQRSFIYKLLINLPKEISIYDPLEVLCPNGNCSMMDSGNRPLFIDDNHLTDFANKEYIFKISKNKSISYYKFYD